MEGRQDGVRVTERGGGSQIDGEVQGARAGRERKDTGETGRGGLVDRERSTQIETLRLESRFSIFQAECANNWPLSACWDMHVLGIVWKHIHHIHFKFHDSSHIVC